MLPRACAIPGRRSGRREAYRDVLRCAGNENSKVRRGIGNGGAMRGLLVYPEFPASSFWSYRHVVRMVGAKATFPPLGLLTLAALMPEHWEFELIDLNVERPSDADLRERFAAADAVFVSAMSVQKRS